MRHGATHRADTPRQLARTVYCTAGGGVHMLWGVGVSDGPGWCA